MNWNPFSWFRSQPHLEERAITYEAGVGAGLILEPTLAGISLNNEKALTVSSFYAGVRHISEAIASLPLRVMEKQPDGGKLPDDDHDLSFLLEYEPNSYIHKADFLEWLVVQFMLYGNAYCKLDIKNSGRVSAIHPIQARFVQISWNREKREATYHVTDNPYNVAEDLSPYETLHIHGLSIDGIAGVNPNELWRESMATSIALERYTAAFFGQACRPSGVLKTAGQLSDKAKANLKESWKRTYTGTSQTGAVPVLEEGLEFEPMSSNNDEFQMIESKQNQVRQMANWCKISPTKCGDLSRATWSNLTEENRQFLMATLNPLLHKIEQEFSRKLLLPSERTTLSIEFDVSGLLRTDDATRYDNNIKACGGPFLTVNEVRAMENKQPVKGGDVLRTGLNQGDASKQDDSEQEPAPADNEATDDEQTKDAD